MYLFLPPCLCYMPLDDALNLAQIVYALVSYHRMPECARGTQMASTKRTLWLWEMQNSILTLSVALKMENSALEARTEEQSKVECVD